MDPMTFDPTIGVVDILQPNVRRIVAPNPSPMTFRGTNTYIVGQRTLGVIDPGPDNDAHLEAILGLAQDGAQITHILVTHSHLDHSPLAARLSSRIGAQIHAYGPSGSGQSAVMAELAKTGTLGGGEGVDHHFAPDRILGDGALLKTDEWTLSAIWTPGHFGNHLSFAMDDVVFCGDHVMDWATSLVSPPDGDLTQFLWSCDRLLSLDAKRFYPGHGAPIQTPTARLNWLIAHRKSREAEIIASLRSGPQTPAQLTDQIYKDVPIHLHPMAERNVLAHLIDLMGKNTVRPVGSLHTAAVFTLWNEDN
jgi:glyoxylase-like metal-dependent hydrolase (beta-lactamase superfamily II)